jgi:hypothetical protein
MSDLPMVLYLDSVAQPFEEKCEERREWIKAFSEFFAECCQPLGKIPKVDLVLTGWPDATVDD